MLASCDYADRRKIKSLISWKILSNNSPEFIIKVFSILSALILPLRIVKVPGLFQQIHLQIIRLTLAPWPGLMHFDVKGHMKQHPKHIELYTVMSF